MGKSDEEIAREFATYDTIEVTEWTLENVLAALAAARADEAKNHAYHIGLLRDEMARVEAAARADEREKCGKVVAMMAHAVETARADERERCAKVCDRYHIGDAADVAAEDTGTEIASLCAAEIRALTGDGK